jgi:hypothetical protein
MEDVLAWSNDQDQLPKPKRDPQLGVATAASALAGVDGLSEGYADIRAAQILEIHARNLCAPSVAMKLVGTQLGRTIEPPTRHEESALVQFGGISQQLRSPRKARGEVDRASCGRRCGS